MDCKCPDNLKIQTTNTIESACHSSKLQHILKCKQLIHQPIPQTTTTPQRLAEADGPSYIQPEIYIFNDGSPRLTA